MTEHGTMERIMIVFGQMLSVNYMNFNTDNSWILVLCTITDSEMARIAIRCEDAVELANMVGCAGVSTIWDVYVDS